MHGCGGRNGSVPGMRCVAAASGVMVHRQWSQGRPPRSGRHAWAMAAGEQAPGYEASGYEASLCAVRGWTVARRAV